MEGKKIKAVALPFKKLKFFSKSPAAVNYRWTACQNKKKQQNQSNVNVLAINHQRFLTKKIKIHEMGIFLRHGIGDE
jgi:hypothetical protein